MKILKRLELEWKILLMAGLLFIAMVWPVHNLIISRLNTTLNQSVDENLDATLRIQLEKTEGAERDAVVASMQRNRQWRALLPIILKEQKRILFIFSTVLFLCLFLIAFWTLKRLTQPLKNLARAVDRIGKGESVTLKQSSGGALGTLEHAVASLSEELDVLREKARVQGMETAWQDIARVMAHEIKNPLTPIRLTLDRIEEKTVNNEQVPAQELHKHLELINSQIDALEKLVNQFRSFSREPEVQLKAVTVADAVQKVADTMTGRLTTDVRCSGVINADPYLFDQVLLNVWKNALEAGAHTITVQDKQNQDSVTISIQDDGPGIEKKNRERVWLPYVTFKKGGTGLGLPVVKKLVETMQGTVALGSVTSGAGTGLCVTMTFPCFQQKEQANG